LRIARPGLELSMFGVGFAYYSAPVQGEGSICLGLDLYMVVAESRVRVTCIWDSVYIWEPPGGPGAVRPLVEISFIAPRYPD
jgi:hypothetical protein